MVTLKNKSYFAVAQRGQCIVIQGVEILAIQRNLAGGGLIERADDI